MIYLTTALNTKFIISYTTYCLNCVKYAIYLNTPSSISMGSDSGLQMFSLNYVKHMSSPQISNNNDNNNNNLIFEHNLQHMNTRNCLYSFSAWNHLNVQNCR